MTSLAGLASTAGARIIGKNALPVAAWLTCLQLRSLSLLVEAPHQAVTGKVAALVPHFTSYVLMGGFLHKLAGGCPEHAATVPGSPGPG